jgi:hypothetical protein
VMCLSCSAVVDDCWRWCPECGGPVAPPFGPLDLRIQHGEHTSDGMLDSTDTAYDLGMQTGHSYAPL